MSFHCRILICWWIVQQSSKCSHLWMHFPDTIKLEWLLRTWKKQCLSHPEEHSVTEWRPSGWRTLVQNTRGLWQPYSMIWCTRKSKYMLMIWLPNPILKKGMYKICWSCFNVWGSIVSAWIQINAPSVFDQENCWASLLARKELKLTLIKSKQFKRCQRQELKSKSEVSSGVWIIFPDSFPTWLQCVNRSLSC